MLLNLDRSKGSRMPAQLELAAKVLSLPCQFILSDLATQLDGGQGLTNQDLSKGSRIPTQLDLFKRCFFSNLAAQLDGGQLQGLTVSVWMTKVACCST